MINIAILISGRGSNAQAISKKCFSGKIPGNIVCFGSDNKEAQGLKFAEENNIPTFSINYKKIISSYSSNRNEFITPDDFDFEEIDHKIDFVPVKDREKYIKTRAVAEKELLDKLSEYKPDLLVLAGFMRTLTPYFIDRYSPDELKPLIMNIHPAILPAFPGIDGYGDTFNYGCKIGGCTVHFVDYGTDSGPIIAQKSFEILPGETLTDIKKKGLEIEWELFPHAVKLFAENRLKIKLNTCSKENRSKSRKTVEIL